MKVVLDTNTIVSAIGWEGPPRRILLALRSEVHRFITSPELLEELTAVLQYPRLRVLAAHPLLPEILAWLHQPNHIVYPRERVTVVTIDPPGNLVLEAAVAGEVGGIISGDHHLLDLKQFRGIEIITAARFERLHL